MPTENPTATDITKDVAAVVELGRRFYASKALLSGAEIGLFTLLAKGPATEPEIRDQLGLHQRATRDFLDALVGLGLLEREGDQYRNSPAADFSLDEAKPSYRGGLLKLLNWQYAIWGDLTKLLRTGERQQPSAYDFKQLYSNPEAIRRFMAAMDGATASIAPALAHAFDWSTVTSFVDVGGGRGSVAAEIAKAHPHLRGGCLDLPSVEPIFDEHMNRLGMTGRVGFHGVDFFADDLPTVDALIFGHVLHDWDDLRRLTLLRKAHDALPAGGQVLIYDAMIDDERRDPGTLLMSLSMQLITPGGSEYTAADCRSWLARAGFAETSAKKLTASDTLVIGRKSA
ncbi:methyltransferase [Actinomycetes bacterium KLBMP 9797]